MTEVHCRVDGGPRTGRRLVFPEEREQLRRCEPLPSGQNKLIVPLHGMRSGLGGGSNRKHVSAHSLCAC